jgi:hypothetical protein
MVGAILIKIDTPARDSVDRLQKRTLRVEMDYADGIMHLPETNKLGFVGVVNVQWLHVLRFLSLLND